MVCRSTGHYRCRPGARSEVTLWAVDYGVLSLTAYQTPDILPSVYIVKALQVVNDDSREKIISRRVLTPKGEDSGGGGGADAGVSQVRRKGATPPGVRPLPKPGA